MTSIIGICGSLRKGSYNRSLLRALPELAPPGMTFTDAPSFRELPLYDADIQAGSGFPAGATAVAEAVRAADGVIVCTPEYNFSVPGGLKNLLDWISRMPNQPFAGKPVAIQSASPGPLGGARMQYDLRRIMQYLDARVLGKPEIFVGSCATRFDAETGALTDATTRNFVQQQLAAFAALIERNRATG